jgi:hypothetical protein
MHDEIISTSAMANAAARVFRLAHEKARPIQQAMIWSVAKGELKHLSSSDRPKSRLSSSKLRKVIVS